LAYPHARLAIEAQSVGWHSASDRLQRDCDKQNLLVRLGWRLLVFTWADVHDRPGSVVTAVLRELKRHASSTLAPGWPDPSSVPSA
jgi:very-short-patch-repair endonuclease